MGQEFRPARDRGGTLFWAILLGSAASLLGVAWFPFEEPVPLLGSVFFTVMALFFTVLALALRIAAPRSLSYTLTTAELQIRHLSGVTRFPLQGLYVRRTTGQLGLMVGGVGVPGYYTGNYRWKGRGRAAVQALASTTREGVLVESGGQVYFLTPAEISDFLNALARRGAVVNS